MSKHLARIIEKVHISFIEFKSNTNFICENFNNNQKSKKKVSLLLDRFKSIFHIVSVK